MSDQNTPSVAQDFIDPIADGIDAEAAILARWEDPAEQVSEDEQEATSDLAEDEGEEEITQDEVEDVETEELDEDPDEEAEEDEDEDEDEEEEVEEIELSDDTLVDIVVDGEQQQASIKDLKRLYGQEQSLTRKSQETARLRKEAESSLEKTHAVMQRMLEQAEERYKPYADIDMMLASKQMSDTDFAQLRKEAKEANDNLKFLKEEADGFYRDVQQQQQQQLQQQAADAVKVLTKEIPDWSNAMYNDIRAYAVSQGLPQQMVDTIVDPSVIMILNKARLFEQGKAVATKKRKAPAKRVLKSKKSPPNAQAVRKQNVSKLAQKASQSTDIDDISALIMANWEE